MKLVVAKCPSCGAEIDVNPKSETTRCKYCRSAIIVEDAIAKYKIEISGNVEVKNLPNLNAHLINANKLFSQEEYEDAYELYKKVISLDPNNYLAILRHSVCKALINNYIDYDLTNLKKAFEEVVELIKSNNECDEKIEECVEDACLGIDESLYAIRKYYNSYAINKSDLNQIQNKLCSIVDCYELILEHAISKKEYIIKQLISVLNDIIKDKNYKTGSAREGGNYINTFKLDARVKKSFSEKLDYYNSLISADQNDSNEESTNQVIKASVSEIKWYNKNWFIIIIGICCPIAGLILVWTCGREMSKKSKIIYTIIVSLFYIIITQ